MTPEEFREQYAEKRGYKHGWWLLRAIETEKAVDDIMKAYALHVIERLERDIDAYDESNLKPFFEEIKKELKS